jgi:F0F1-type ATP synthase assembly protein I
MTSRPGGTQNSSQTFFYVQEDVAMAFLPLGISFGLCLGLILGLAIGNLPLGMLLGTIIGAGVGAVLMAMTGEKLPHWPFLWR